MPEETTSLRHWVADMKKEYGDTIKKHAVIRWLVEKDYVRYDHWSQEVWSCACNRDLFKTKVEFLCGNPRRSVEITDLGREVLTPLVVKSLLGKQS